MKTIATIGMEKGDEVASIYIEKDAKMRDVMQAVMGFIIRFLSISLSRDEDVSNFCKNLEGDVLNARHRLRSKAS